VYSKLKLPRLGAVLLGTIARQLGWDVRVYVEEIADIDYRDALTADLVGISTITSTASRAYAIADALRDFGVPVVMGGPHVTFLTDEALAHCDYVVRGEGEEALPALMNALFGDGDLRQVPNLSYRDAAGEVHHNEQTSMVEDLEALPYPDYELIVGWRKAMSFSLRPVVPIQATRGCPFGCRFCSVIGMFGRKVRTRSVDNVIGELRRHRERNAHIFFYDDNFTARRAWVKELIRRAMIDEQLCPHWSAQVRTDATQDDELLALMQRGKCSHVYVGFETVNPAALADMAKQQNVQSMIDAVGRFRQHRIGVHGMFIFGFDADTKESFRATTRFAMRSGIDSAQFLILTLLPGTPVYEEMAAAGRITVHDWAHYDGHHVCYKPARISAWQLQWAQVRSHAMFYSRLRMMRQLVNGYLGNSAIYLYARKLNHEWIRNNKTYLKALKLAAQAKNTIIRFDFEIDFSEIKQKVWAAAGSLALPMPTPA